MMDERVMDEIDQISMNAIQGEGEDGDCGRRGERRRIRGGQGLAAWWRDAVFLTRTIQQCVQYSRSSSTETWMARTSIV